jgi:hypothetical protein
MATTSIGAPGVTFPDATVQATSGVTTVNGKGPGVVQSVITLGAAVATTSGTSNTISSIPSWVKRVTLMFNGVSTNGGSNKLIQFGTSGGISTTNYQSLGLQLNNGGVATTNSTAGFLILSNNALHTLYGSCIFTLQAANVWAAQYCFNDISAQNLFPGSGQSILSGALTSIRLTTVNGTDAFDAGSISASYE